MQIIDIGICIDNNDPKGIGRIRCVRYADYVSEKERAISYEPYSDSDPFMAIPFLPTNINFIPEVEQSVKLINYNTSKEHVNTEYIAGPFTTSHDYNGQTFSQQLTDTTYGIPFKDMPDIFNSNGTYRDPETKSSLANKNDYAIYGKYGSDVLFTENGLQLRGGKLVSKSSVNGIKKTKLISSPLMAKKSSTLFLKKFPKKLKLTKIVDRKLVNEIKDLSIIVEYDIVFGEDSIVVNFYVYDVIKPNEKLKTDFFNENTELMVESVKLINLTNDNTTPTHAVTIDNAESESVPNAIRDVLYSLNELGLKKINVEYKKHRKSDGFVHPFYFRPTLSLNNRTHNNTQKTFINEVFNAVKFYDVIGPKSGLVWSLPDPVQRPKENIIERQVLKVDSNVSEQSFSAIKSDKIFLLSTDVNETNKSVNFSSLNDYDLTQDDYLQKIEPNTFSTVRGENLLQIIIAMANVLLTHQHNLIGPMVTDGYEEYRQLSELLKNMENDMLNKSIKVN
jgi:hypothetical protein